jgi:hypothetical protein
MIEPIREEAIECPYCGSTFTALIDLSEGSATTIHDCEVCCRPITLDVATAPDGSVELHAWRDDDA